MPHLMIGCLHDATSDNVDQVKDFIRNHGGRTLDDLEDGTIFGQVHDGAEVPEQLTNRLRDHDYVDDLLRIVPVTYTSSSNDETMTVYEPEDSLSFERRRLLEHLGLSATQDEQPSNSTYTKMTYIFIESAPSSPRGAKCRLPGCERTIEPGSLRLALHPGMDQGWWRNNTTFLYHIECFERIADFTQLAFIQRVLPVTRNTWKYRNLNVGGILDGNYFVSAGVERLIQEWREVHAMWAAKRDDCYDETQDVLPANLDALLYQSGSAVNQEPKKPGRMKEYEYLLLRTMLAPNESDGPEDPSEWNLFSEYIDSAAEALDNPHDLSTMLQRWQTDVLNLCILKKLAKEDESELDDSQVETKHALGEKPMRALRRLSGIPMVDTHTAFWGI
ncbi:hypothetical protein N7457_007163 [Penicillium paradoxum]|uniref:uncharacterized protein n=1 Tax=Penicillium paradoxum TaxID=176176 RepID=UPI0025498BAA|nr:uncharacterized protein N7457_007163 [Penicillium paradoxum]KAJ5779443.1 hypothetical protein N7457_007163 [Penicillium paradoxum]